MQDTHTTLKTKRSVSKGWVITFSILGFLIIAIAGGIWYWNAHKKAIIRNKLESVIRDKSDGLYKIKYDSISMDELAGNLSISNMKLSYDSVRYLELKQMGKRHSVLFDIFIPEISVSGVKTSQALIEKEVVGRKLEIKNPVINIFYTDPGVDTSVAVPAKEIYEQLLGKLDLIKADTILISGAEVITSNLRTKKTGMQIQNISVVLVDVKIDSSSSADTTRIFFARESTVTCGKLDWSSPDKLYNYKAEKISLSSTSRNLRIKSFRIIPTLNEEAFVKKLPTQGDRFDFSVSNIELQNINLRQLLEENIVADNMLLPGVSLKIYRDLIIPRDKKNRVGTYPHQLMQTIPITFRVKKIVVMNGFIEYKERHQISRLAGKIQYHHVNASISNFTNDKKVIAANNIMTVAMKTRFLDKAPLQITGRFYLLHPKGRFDLNGTFGAMDATFLNPVIERTGLTHIKTGMINGASFSVQGEDYVADGTVQLLYENLKVAALEKDKGASQLDKKAFSSFIVNFIIKDDNPKKNREVRVARVHLERNTNASFFNFSWKVIFKGIKEIVGLKE
jgi:hypothetical protein